MASYASPTYEDGNYEKPNHEKEVSIWSQHPSHHPQIHIHVPPCVCPKIEPQMCKYSLTRFRLTQISLQYGFGLGTYENSHNVSSIGLTPAWFFQEIWADLGTV